MGRIILSICLFSLLQLQIINSSILTVTSPFFFFWWHDSQPQMFSPLSSTQSHRSVCSGLCNSLKGPCFSSSGSGDWSATVLHVRPARMTRLYVIRGRGKVGGASSQLSLCNPSKTPFPVKAPPFPCWNAARWRSAADSSQYLYSFFHVISEVGRR